MIENYGVGDLVIAHPYRDNLFIEVTGYIVKLGRGMFSKIPFVKIKGVKKNTYGDVLSFSIKMFKHDFDLISELTPSTSRKS